MKILVNMLDGSLKKGNVEETTSVDEVMNRLKIPAECSLTLAGIHLDRDRTLGEYGISHGMELEVLDSGEAHARTHALMAPDQRKKPSSKSDIAGKGENNLGTRPPT